MNDNEYSPGAFIQIVADHFDGRGEDALREGWKAYKTCVNDGKPLTREVASEIVQATTPA